MIIGQTILAEDSNASTLSTPWMPRQGDAVTSTFEVIEISADAKLTLSIFDKNSETSGEGMINGTASGTDNLSSVSVSSFRNVNLEELIRYQVKLEYTGVSTSTVYCHFRILNPAWETTGPQSI